MDDPSDQPDSATDQTATPPKEELLTDFHPFYNILLWSRNKAVFRPEEPEDSVIGFMPMDVSLFWKKLEIYFKVNPTIKLLNSESLRKERSEVRILKAKSRLIRTLQGLINRV